MEILLTKSTTPIIGQFAWLLGWIMNGIYEVLQAIGIPNIGLAIIFYTIIVYILMTPMQISQQKMSKMMAIIQPEINEVQKKYQGRKDSKAQEMMQAETMAIYEKYGYSPMGSCLPLLIQMPLLFALYQVIYRIPAYITRVGKIYTDLAESILKVDGATEIVTNFVKDNSVRVFGSRTYDTVNSIKDFLYMLKPAQWTKLQSVSEFSSMKDAMADVASQAKHINSFLGLNISESPIDIIVNGFQSKEFLVMIIAVLIPVLAWFTQWLNYKLMPQQNNQGAAANSMKTMSTTMPLVSAVMCCTLSTGIGIYWITGAVVRCVQQVVINQRIAKMDPQVLIEKSKAKAAKKKKKESGVTSGSTVSNAAKQNVKKISNPKYSNLSAKEVDYAKNADKARPDSITAKANMVKNFNDKNKKK